jgi:DNA-binding transcriptional ArsR family regulator
MSHAAPPRHTNDLRAIHALQGRRLDIAKALADGPMTVSELTVRFGLSLGAIGGHLQVMRYAGLVTQTGAQKPYHLNRDAFAPLAALFASLAEPQAEGDAE